MDNNESTRESPTPAQKCPTDTAEFDGNANGTPIETVTTTKTSPCSLIKTNDLDNILKVENQHQHDFNDSNCNSNSNACQFTGHHHYHYIEYPGMYYQQKNTSKNNGIGLGQSINSNGNNYHYCVCSCSSVGGGGDDRMQISTSTQPQLQPQNERSRLAVAAIVHHQSIDADSSGLRTKSQQSLLSHSYQMLNLPTEKNSESHCHTKLHIDCDLDGNCASTVCSCEASVEQQQQQQQHPIKRCKKLNDTLADSMLATDEITVSESDNNGSLTKRKNMREARVQKKINSWYAKNYNCNHIEIYSDGDGDGDGDEADNNHRNDANTVHGSLTNILDQRPPLPPRPQPITTTRNTNSTFSAHRPGSQSIKKYVIWCLVCGGFSCLLGALFLGVYFLLHSYTITVGNFETVPTFVPATLLILTGLCIMSLARRRNRYSYLIKLSGACGLISALTCALVTVTTTVLHMSRLQALRECEYAQKTRTCTCYSDMIESQVDRVDKEGVRLVFDSLSDCGVVHGSLYSCLRAIFGLSVAGVLVAVFSCMLVYQLLSHERKKMYWEQLELRCRSLYTSHQQQHPHQHPHSHQHQHPHQQQGPNAHNMVALTNIGTRSAPICRCCEQCHAHRQLQLQTTASYPWVDDAGEPRFWAGQPPGNFYSPNPGGDDNNLHIPHTGSNNRSRISSGWSWPRMPWQRGAGGGGSGAGSSTETGNRFRQIPSSPDSQYGFSSTNPSLGLNVSNVAVSGATAVADDDVSAAAAAVAAAAQAYNIVPGGGAALPYGIWGPPPPYSDPNSPARRGYYQYMQPPSNNICTSNRTEDNAIINNNNNDDILLQQRPLSALNALAVGSTPNVVSSCVAARAFDHISQRLCTTEQLQNVYKSKENSVGNSLTNTNGIYGNTGSDSDVESTTNRFGDRFSNTLPTRKTKKRSVAVVDGSNSITKCIGSSSRHQINSSHHHHHHRINVQRVFPNSSNSTSENDADINSNMRTINNLRYGSKPNNNNIVKQNQKCVEDGNDGSNSNQINLQKMLVTDHHHHHQHHTMESNALCLNNLCDGDDMMANAGAIVSTINNCDAPYEEEEDPTESEIYFADVSSCCNMSMKNDNCYGDSSRNIQQQQQRHGILGNQPTTTGSNATKHMQKNYHQQLSQHQHQRRNCSQSSNFSSAGCCTPKEENPNQQHFCHRETSIRCRNQSLISQIREGDGYNNKKLNTTSTGTKIGDNININTNTSTNESIKLENSIPKDSSLHSMCSNDSEARTECTDLSPMTPCSNKNLTETLFQCGSNTNINNNTNTNTNTNNNAMPQTPNIKGSNFSNFIASFPYSSELKFHEAHRRYTKHIHDNLIITTTTTAPTTTDVQEAHYEIINDDGNNGKVKTTNTVNKSMRVPAAAAAAATATISSSISSTSQSQQRNQTKNLHSCCNFDTKSSINRVTTPNRCQIAKAKDNLDGVWSSSDASGSGHNHNRQRL